MTEILKMEGITKIYSNGVIANKDANFSINKGEIHALIGENGAGKTTLMKILFGLEAPDYGTIYLKGNKVVINSPDTAIENGIGMVHQHFMLVKSLTVAENLILGIEPKKGLFLNFNKAVNQVSEISNKYNFKIDPKATIDSLPVASRQKVEILKALIRGVDILILDEPTAVLTPQETDELFTQLVKLKENGLTIIFISHKLNEIKKISDRITIMRSGRVIGTYNTSEISEEDISKLMVGRDVITEIDKNKSKPGDVALSVRDLKYDSEGKEILKGISFNLRKGCILGIAGVEGNGQRELIDIITGIKKFNAGTVTINGKDIKNQTIKDIRKSGVSYIPEDRMTMGVAKDAAIWENLISDRYMSKQYNKQILMVQNKINDLSNNLIDEYKIKCSSNNQTVGMLSGGNIQKVVVAREFSSAPKLLIAEQPTRGIDIGASIFIRRKIVELRDKGTAVLLVSADLNEVMELSDNLIVMYNGQIVAYFDDVSKINEEELGVYMLGLKKQTIGDALGGGCK